MTPADLAASAKACDLSDADIEDLATRAARQVKNFAELWQARGAADTDALRSLRRVARGYRVDMPAKDTLPQLLNRMCAPAWWRVRREAVGRSDGAVTSL